MRKGKTEVKLKLLVEDATFARVVVILKDEGVRPLVGWFVKDQYDKKGYAVLGDDGSISTFRPSHIKYLAYLNGSCIFKGAGKYLIPLPQEPLKEKLRKIQILINS